MNILFLEDCPEVTNIIKGELESLGHKITHFESPAGIEIVDGFDLLLTDNRMPNMTGVEFIEQLRNADEDIPIILHSADNPLELAAALKGMEVRIVEKLRLVNLLDEIERVRGEHE